MRIITLVTLLFLVISLSAQNKKFIKIVTSDDSKKIEALRSTPDFQENLDYHLVYAVHTYNNDLLDACIALGADPQSKCGDCYQRDAITVALYYENYYAYNKLKAIYEYTGAQDEFGGNILHAAAGCTGEVLLEVINTYHPEFLFIESGSPLFRAFNDSTVLPGNVSILMDHYFNQHREDILNEVDPAYGTNLLVDVVFENNLELTKELVQAGFDPFQEVGDFYEEDFRADYIASAFLVSMIHDDHQIYDYFRTLNYDFTKFVAWRYPAELEEDENGEIITYSSIAFFICQNTDKKFVQQIDYEFGVNYNTSDHINLDTPMLFAVSFNNKMMVKHILDQSWDGYYYKTALKWAKDKDIDPEIYEMLDQYVSENFK
jgi:hypothetical protein